MRRLRLWVRLGSSRRTTGAAGTSSVSAAVINRERRSLANSALGSTSGCVRSVSTVAKRSA